MAKITTIINPLTGQPAQVDQLDHTAQEIDDAIARALPGGAIDTTLQKKADLFTTLQMAGVDRNVEVSSAGWHRLIELNGYTQSAILHIKHQYYSNGPCDMLVYVSCIDKYAVHILSATSYLNNVITIDDLRLVSNSTTGKYYLDIHYKYNGINGIGVDIIGTTAQADWLVGITRMNLESVDTLPDGETVLKTAEWENPPMLLGVEYRTTERYLGKPVYVKAVDFGTLPSASRKSVDHGASNVDKIISAYGFETNGTSVFNIPQYASAGDFVFCFAGKELIYVDTGGDLSGWSANVIIKYTKTTD